MRRTTARSIDFEPLEHRQLFAGTIVSTLLSSFRTIDGTGNNLAHPEWGSVGVDLLRRAAATYADGISAPGGVGRPSARMISNALSSMDPDENILNDRDLSAFIYAWGQFIDHDLDLTTGGAAKEAYNVSVPMGDGSFDPLSTGSQWIYLTRSQYDPATGTSTKNPRQQVNSITAWIDGSVVYGSDAARAAALRTFVGGKLKTSEGNLMSFNTDLLANANDAHLVSDAELFLAGDVRANENVELTSIQTLFVREHNRLADQIKAQNPKLTDEQIYQQARAMVGAEIQAITYNEFLPALLGSISLGRYRGYNASVNPGIANEFSTAAYRIGHTMIGNDVEFLDNNGEDVAEEMSMASVFFNPPVVEQTGIDPILKYLASDRMQEVDTKIVDPLRNFLFGPPGAGGFDLASLNIQRGRDHGLADYNTARAAYGLGRVSSFSQITSDPTLQQQLKDLYGSVNNIDLWVGGLAEDHVRGSSMGPTFGRIIADQFQRLRDGDRFWYERQFSGRQLDALQHTTLADIIKRNTELTNLQSNVFVFEATVRGTVFADANRNGRQDRREAGLGGWTVQLLDEDGNVLDTTVTNRSGNYTFTELELDTYQVQIVIPAGWKQTTAAPDDIQLTRGTVISGVSFGVSRAAVGNAAVASATSPLDSMSDVFDPLGSTV